MITQNLSFTISCEGQDVVWTLTTDNDCVTFSQNTGVVTGNNQTVNVVAYFQDEDCLESTTITVTATDENGLSTTKEIEITNDCTSLNGYISSVPLLLFPYAYEGTAFGGTAPYTYAWYYDASIFFNPGEVTNQKNLKLKLRNAVPVPQSTTIQLVVTDAKGCTEQLFFTQAFRGPKAKDISGRVACYRDPVQNGICGEVDGMASNVVLEAVPGPGTSIDWDTLDLKIVDGICIGEKTIDGNTMTINLYFNDVPEGNYSLPWTVKDKRGLESNTAQVYLTVPECNTPGLVYAQPQYQALTAAQVAGATVEVDLTNLVHPKECCDEVPDGKELDWNTFTFVATSGQTLVSATELTTTNGTAELQKNRTLLYTPGSKSCDTDLVQFTIENKDGELSNTGKIVFDWERLAAPVAVADAACVKCGETVAIEVLANDTGTIDPYSLEVMSAPTKGTYTVGRDGKIYFTAGSNKTGNDFIGYRVANPDGEVSNTATVTIDIVCAGTDYHAGTICKTTIDLTGYLPSYATAGGTWSASLSNPSVVSLVDPTAVDFSSATAGSYAFTYSVTSGGGCNARIDITLTLLADQANDDCADAVTMAFPPSVSNTIQMHAQAITPCATDSGVALPAGWYADYQADSWYKFTTNALTSVKVFVDATKYGEGLEDIQIAVYSGACGGLVDVASVSVRDGSRYAELNLSGLTGSTQYTVRVSGSNTGSFSIGLTS